MCRQKVKDIDIIRGLELSMYSARNTVHDQLNYNRECSCRLPKSVADDCEARLLKMLRHLTYYADQWDQFLQFSLTGDETWFSDETPESRITSLLLKHAISPRRWLQSFVVSKKSHSDHMCMLPVYFLQCGELKNVIMVYVTGYSRLFDAKVLGLYTKTLSLLRPRLSSRC